MKGAKPIINPSSSSSYSYDKIQNNIKNNNDRKNNKSGFSSSLFGVPPYWLWPLFLTSIFAFFLLYSPIDDFHYSAIIPINPVVSMPIKPHQSGDVEKAKEECELFKGKWVKELNASQYTASSCVTIPDSKNCQNNGRIDNDFVNWRWKPEACHLPRFDAYKFLQLFAAKKLAFIGDSVARNHFESLLCLLSKAETPVDVYKDSEDRFRTWHFPSSNFTLMILWSKFLIKSEEIMVNNSGSGSFNLHLDEIDEKWASKLPGLDYIIISDAHWFFRKNYLYNQGKLIGCVYCNEPNITELGLNFSIRMSFRTALKYVNDCKGCNKDMVTIVRTFSPAHFENGAWDTGGVCNRTSPHGEEKTKEIENSSELVLRNIQVEELERVKKEGLGRAKKFRVLDVTRAMLMRPDGHPGEFWGNKWMKGYNDCVHWCMPGPIDVWSDLLFAVLQRG